MPDTVPQPEPHVCWEAAQARSCTPSPVAEAEASGWDTGSQKGLADPSLGPWAPYVPPKTWIWVLYLLSRVTARATHVA